LLDPCSVELAAESGALGVGNVAALNATAAAAGSWIAGASAAGYPGVGVVLEDGAVRPFLAGQAFKAERFEP
jgi:hypothetical protein